MMATPRGLNGPPVESSGQADSDMESGPVAPKTVADSPPAMSGGDCSDDSTGGPNGLFTREIRLALLVKRPNAFLPVQRANAIQQRIGFKRERALAIEARCLVQ